jgi:hypothetical protein
MKQVLMTAAIVSFVAFGPCAVAQAQQESPTKHSENSSGKDQAMKECMARQKASNSGLTDLQMQTTCKNEINADKTRKDGNDLATGPQSGDKQPEQ